jgi:ABC-type multidrug transport system fused ATPase/permease subunit
VPIFKGLDLQILSGERVVIQGRSGAGKTTLYKLLTSAYPSILDLTQQPFHVSFSPQHPLLLPDSTSLEENLDPYQLKRKLKAV